MNQQALRDALDAYDYWEVDGNAHQKQGKGNAWQGDNAAFKKTDVDPPVYRYVRIWHRIGGIMRVTNLVVAQFNDGNGADFSLSGPLPPTA